MTITLESIEAQHQRVAAMIAEFKAQPRPVDYLIPAVTFTLASGERYAGVVLDDDGHIAHHLILLPGDAEDLDFDDANAWAAERGGSLPTRREQSLLFANLKGEFESAWYWSVERHESNSGWAWFQTFVNGYQTSHGTISKLRARAVRRFIPSVI